MPQKHISTGVDKLVSLVEEKNKIAIKEAAKKLAVPIKTIQEWAHFLEEENIIYIEFSLAGQYLVKRKLSKEEKSKQVQAFNQNRDSFSSRVEAATSYFNELDKQIEAIDAIVGKIDMSYDVDTGVLKKDLGQLSILEKEKEALDTKLINSKKKTEEAIEIIEKHITREEHAYEKVFKKAIDKFEDEKLLLQSSRSLLQEMKEQEKDLATRMRSIQVASTVIQKKVTNARENAEVDTKEIEHITKKHQQLQKNLQKDHDKLKAILKTQLMHEKAIKEQYGLIFARIETEINKIAADEATIKNAPAHIKKLLQKREKVADSLALIRHEEEALKINLDLLRKKAKIITTVMTKKEFKEIEAKISTITQKRTFFKRELKRILFTLQQ